MKRLLIVMLALSAVGLIYAGTASAAPNPCGTVTTNTTFQEDCSGPLIVGADNIHVNLGGHNVTCGDTTNNGIVLTGRTRVVVSHGAVSQCQNGIVITGGSNNELKNLDVFGNNLDGIQLNSTNNNKIRSTNSNANQAVGIRLTSSNGNVVDGSAADLNVSVPFVCMGLELNNSDNNTIRTMSIESNGDFGVLIDSSSDGNTLQSSRINHTFFVGVNLPGVLVFGTNNLIQSNTANDNDTGIWLFLGATGNTVMSNEALGNVSFDLRDDNPGCDANVWKNNRFVTANQGCIS